MKQSISTKLPSNVKIYETIEEFHQNLPNTVDLLQTSHGSNVYVIGTAHFSLKSQDDVSFVIRNARPDVILLELCPLRMHVLLYDENFLLKESSELGLRKICEIFRQHGISGGIFYMRFLQTNANITRQLGVAPGGECRRAVAEAIALQKECFILLGDRPINITMQRAIRSLSLLDKIQISIMFLLNSKRKNEHKITMADIEQLKTEARTKKPTANSNDEEKLKSIGATGNIYKAFVTERDLLLCHSLQMAAIRQKDSITGLLKPITVVGVVGIGHSDGIVKNWGKVTAKQIENLMIIPPESVSMKLFNKSLKIGIISLLGYGVYELLAGGKKSGKVE